MTSPTIQRTQRPRRQGNSPRLWSLLAILLILRHREKQERIADLVESDMARAWKILDFHNLGQTEVPWLDTSLDKLAVRHEQSQRATGDLVNDLRTLVALERRRSVPEPIRFVYPSEDVAADDLRGPVVVAKPMDERRVAKRLLAMGPGAVKHAMPAPEDVAMPSGLSGATGVAVESVGEGGRTLSLQAAEVDDELVGYQRVCESDSRVCAFCALLASRGPVYFDLGKIAATDTKWSLKEREGDDTAHVAALDSTPDSSAKAHAHCRCTLIPVFASNRLGVFGWAEVAEKIWNDPDEYGWEHKGDWVADRRAFRKAFDAYKASHPEEGADGFDYSALRAALNDVERDRTDYEMARFLNRVTRGL